MLLMRHAPAIMKVFSRIKLTLNQATDAISYLKIFMSFTACLNVLLIYKNLLISIRSAKFQAFFSRVLLSFVFS